MCVCYDSSDGLQLPKIALTQSRSRWEPRRRGFPSSHPLGLGPHAATEHGGAGTCPKEELWETSRQGEALPPLLATAMRQDCSCGPCRSEMCPVTGPPGPRLWPLACALWSPGLWIGRRLRQGPSSSCRSGCLMGRQAATEGLELVSA